jgi:hypothetical protein
VNELLAVLGLVGAVLVIDILAATLGVDSRDTLPDDHHR